MKKFLGSLIALLLISTPVFAAGPTGFGPIKLGMTQPQVEALTSSAQAIYIKAELTPYEYPKSATPPQGVASYDAALQTPFSSAPIKSVLTFTAGKLSKITLNLDSDDVFEKLKSQITEKYGAPKTNNERKEEQCIYKNGANFKMPTGSIEYAWTMDKSAAGRVSTRLIDHLSDFCPPDLSFPRMTIKGKSLIIMVTNDADPKKIKNAF